MLTFFQYWKKSFKEKSIFNNNNTYFNLSNYNLHDYNYFINQYNVKIPYCHEKTTAFFL